MIFWAYIFYSQSTGRYYCGHTDDLNRRISQHNNPECTSTRTTKILKGPCEQLYGPGRAGPVMERQDACLYRLTCKNVQRG